MALEDNIFTLTASNYNDIAKHSKVVNVNELDYFLWVYLNPEDVRDAYFLSACEVIKPGQDAVTTFTDTFERKSTSWIQIKTDFINKKTGLHIYKLNFVNYTNDVTFSLYASYTIQRDDEEKPYIYMKRDNQT